MIKIFPKISVPQISVGKSNRGNVASKKKDAIGSAKKQIQISSARDEKPLITLQQALEDPKSFQKLTKDNLFEAESSKQVLESASIKSVKVKSKLSKQKIKPEEIPTTIALSSPPVVAGPIAPVFTIPPVVLQTLSIGASEFRSGSIEISTVGVESSGAPIVSSGSFSMGLDVYNLDTAEKDLRSYQGELLYTFDQIESVGLEMDIISLIYNKTTKKIIIPFRLSTFDQFFIKIYDMFFDRKVFYNGFSLIENADEYLKSQMYPSTMMTAPSNSLWFSRQSALDCANRNVTLLSRLGISSNFIILSDSDEKKARATKLLQIGAVEYDYNFTIMTDTIFVHKIFAFNITIPPPTLMPGSTIATDSTITLVTESLRTMGV